MALKHLLFVSFAVALSAQNFPELKIGQGTLRGKYQRTQNGRLFYAFYAIPYAEPPVGKLRFERPVAAKPWLGVLDAVTPANVCPQANIFFGDTTIIGNEDCLYLNVYTPQLQQENSTPLPVLVFLHGGALSFGSGNSEYYGPDLLLDRNVVLVTLNYRLGALGFLSTEDELMPGNNGLKDQSLAIKWVKDNIGYFGGDSNKITVFGQSAGSASAQYHAFSDLSKHLISGVISHSGVVTARLALALKGEALQNCKKLASFLNCPTESNKKVIECLRNIDAYDIIKQDVNFMEWAHHPLIPFKPVIEPNVEGAFLTESPLDIIKSGKSADIPFIIGMTTAEGAGISITMYNSTKLIEELNNNFVELAPLTLQYQNSTNKEDISVKLRKFYFGSGNIDESTKANLTDMFTDGYFMYPQDIAAKLHVKYNKAPVYNFLFDFRGVNSLGTLYGDPKHDYGVCHGDDLLYLFNNKLFPDHQLTKSERKIIDIMTTMWENFAASGNPTPHITPLIPTKWKPVQKGNSISYYVIKNYDNITMADDLYQERFDFWKNLDFDESSIKFRDEL